MTRTLPISTMNITGLRAIRRGSSLRRLSTRRRAGRIVAARAGSAGSSALAQSCQSCSTIGPEREDGEVRQPDDDEDDADEQRRRTAACSVGNVPAVAGHGCLRASEPAIASTGTIRQEAPDQHRQTPSVVLYQSVFAGQATERRAVVVRGRREGVDDLGEPVRAGVEDRATRPCRARTETPAKPRTSGGTTRM